MPTGKNGLDSSFPTALVTGASSGIGAAIASGLIREGVTVYGTSRDPHASGRDPNVRWLGFDGSSSEGIQAFLKEQEDLLSNLNLLINNAGSSLFGKASDIPPDALLSQQSLLLQAPLQLTNTVLRGMRERRAGAIVNVSSLAAIFPLPYMEGYSSAKAALSAYSQGLMNTEGGSGIMIVDFQAGDFRTSFNRNIRRCGEPDEAQDRVWRRLEENIAAAPPPERAADDLVRCLKGGRSAIVCSGGFFQKHIAPLGVRLLPRKMLLRAIRRYYNLSKG